MSQITNLSRYKILYVLPSFSVGGIERQFLAISPYLIEAGFDVHLITLFDYKNRINLYDQLPKEIKVSRLDARGLKAILELVKFIFLVKKIKPNIVVASMSSGHFAAVLARIFIKFRLILREHNTYSDKRWFHWKFDRFASLFTSSLVAVSSDVADFASKNSGISRERYEVITNGVDVLKYKPASISEKEDARNKLDIPNDCFVILNAARLKPQKNQALLLEAFSLFKEKNPKSVLLMAGDGSERLNLEKKTDELGISDSVRFLGFVAEPSLLFFASDVAVLTSYREGFPNFLVESLASGLSVITTKVSGVSEIKLASLDSKAFQIVDRKPKSVSLAIENVFKSERKSLEAVDIAKKFDLKEISKKYCKLFVRLVENQSVKINQHD